MNRTQLEHIIRAASQISGDTEIVVVGSQAIHASDRQLPAIVFQSQEADVFPRNHPERADDIDGAIGELSQFHNTYGYYAHGVGPQTALLPDGWQSRVVPITSPDTGGATGLCLDVHDLVLSKYAAGREKDLAFNAALIRAGCVRKRRLFRLVRSMPIDPPAKDLIRRRIEADFAAANSRRPAVPPR